MKKLSSISIFSVFVVLSGVDQAIAQFVDTQPIKDLPGVAGHPLPHPMTNTAGLLAQTEPPPVPIGAVTLINNTVTIRLINQTGAVITYEVIGDTQIRTLAGNAEATLQNLTVPITVTFRRQDSGLLQASLSPNSPAGVLELTLSATTELAADRTVLNVGDNGEVFLN
jgi:hypothetical protein